MAENTKESSSEDKVLVVRHFHPGLCAKCYKRPTQKDKMKNCAQCQLVSYCSKACQKSDWKEHKPLCSVNPVEDGKNIFSTAKEARNKGDWIKLRTALDLAANVGLGRKLKPFEMEIIWGPKVCEVCRESNPSKLIGCPTCYSVFYCSSDHMEEDFENHADWCSSYARLITVDSFEHEHGIELSFAINIFKCYSPLQKDMTELLNEELVTMKMDVDSFAGVLYTIMTSAKLTDALTLLKAMESFYIGKDQLRINQVRKLVIHVVGAECMREMLGIIRWEYLAHRLPSLKELIVMFVGPNVLPEDSDEVLPEVSFWDNDAVGTCEECRKDGRVFKYGLCAMEYHRFIKKAEYIKPDVIVAYNCGFHQYSGLEDDTWPESVKIMISDPIVPLIFTSYTKTEAQEDLQVIRNVKVKAEVTIPTHLNPFKSLRPVRDFGSDNGTPPIFYLNHYVTGVNGQRI